MKLYIPGPMGPDQLADKWQLEQRGYTVSTATELHQRDLKEHGTVPDPGEFARQQMYAMLCADGVVVHDQMTTAQVYQVVKACEFAGVRVFAQEELPAQCPNVLREDEIANELDLTSWRDEPTVAQELRQLLVDLTLPAQRFAAWFNTHMGWFFRNGNKPEPQPTPRPYPTAAPQPPMTA